MPQLSISCIIKESDSICDLSIKSISTPKVLISISNNPPADSKSLANKKGWHY
jgi:hypothetical protein